MPRKADRMSDTSFKLMTALFAVLDFVYPYVARRARTFGLQEGTTVVDYGCGPGRYTVQLARLVGPAGKVYAVDVHELAVAAVQEKVQRQGLNNVIPVLAHGYDSGLPDGVADMVCAIDMFFSVREPTIFLRELKRITKPGGVLVIDDGHQSRAMTKAKLLASGCWVIVEERRDHLQCRQA